MLAADAVHVAAESRNIGPAVSRSPWNVNDRCIARPAIGPVATAMRISLTPGRRSRSKPDRQSRTWEM